MAADNYDQNGGNGGYGDNIDPNTGLPTNVKPTYGDEGGGQSGGSGSTTDDGPGPGQRIPRHGAGGGFPSDTFDYPDPQPQAPAPVFSGGGYTPFTSTIKQDPRWSALVDTLMGRANQSLNIDPATDSVIRPQVDNYGATQTRMARQAIDSQAEAGSPYATGSLQSTRNQANEKAGFNTANLQSSLMTNELTARRKDITDALQESGQLLTSDQQFKLQEELGLIDANLKQQGLSSQNDQFLANFGLNQNNQNSYWDAIRRGLL